MKARMANNLMKVAALAILCSPLLRAQDIYRKPEPPDDVKALQAKPTPKAADGHPDLSARWVPISLGRVVGARDIGARIEGNVHDLYFGTPIEGADPEKDAILTLYGDESKGGGTGEDRRKVRQTQNRPAYKPEFQEKVDRMGKDPNHYDPTNYSCLPAGVPRVGVPGMIVQSRGMIVLLYGARPYSTFRVVPTDGRPHRTVADVDPSPW